MATLEEIKALGGSFTPITSLPKPQTTAQTVDSGVPQMKIAPTPQDTTDYSSIINTQIASIPQLQQEQKQSETNIQSSTDVLKNLLMGQAQIPTASADQSVIDAQQNVDKYNTQQAQINAQAQALQRQAQAIPLQAQQGATGQGITDRGLAPLTTAQLRDNAIQSLALAQQSDINQAALTGSQIALQNATNKAQQIVDLKYKAYETAIAVEKLNYQQNKDMLERIDKKQSDALGLAIKKEEQAIADKKQKEKDVAKLIVDASPVAPPDVLQKAKDIQANGGSPIEVAMALGQYGGDYYQTALLKEQIQTQRAQRAKIYTETGIAESTANKTEVDSWVSNIASGKAKLSDVPSKLKGAVSVGLSQTTISSPETKSKIEASQNVYNLAQELKTLEGKGGAVGFGLKKTVFSKIIGIDEGAISGTDRANYEAKFNQLKDTLASANLDKLKGAMSDKDIQFLRNIGTALTLDMPESAFDAELDKVAETMAKVPGVQSIKVNNKFNTALGKGGTQFTGTEIINNVQDDGSIDFKLP